MKKKRMTMIKTKIDIKIPMKERDDFCCEFLLRSTQSIIMVTGVIAIEPMVKNTEVNTEVFGAKLKTESNESEKRLATIARGLE